MLQYFLGEGAACRHSIALLSSSSSSSSVQTADTQPPRSSSSPLYAFLPKLIDPNEQQQEQKHTQKNATTSAVTDNDNSNNTGGTNGGDAVELRIAWQYGRYLKRIDQSSSSNSRKQGSGGRGEWCHAFDITKPATPMGLTSSTEQEGTPRVVYWCPENNDKNYKNCVDVVREFIHNKNSSRTKTATSTSAKSIGRIAIAFSPAMLTTQTATTRVSLVQAMVQLKSLVRDTTCAVVVTVPWGLMCSSSGDNGNGDAATDKIRLCHVADCVLAVEAVRDDADLVRMAPDPGTIVGLLHVQKMASVGLVAAPEPQHPLYLIRKKRRKLVFAPIEIDPDAEEGGEGGQQQQQQQQSAASMVSKLCGSGGGGGANTKFDF